MPCCCATNVKAAFVLGIDLAVLSGLSCFKGGEGAIAKGIIGVVIHCILIFGAHTRNSTAILVWMSLAILDCIGLAIMAILGIIGILEIGEKGFEFVQVLPGQSKGVAVGYAVIFVVFCIGIILFEIWTIIVAKNARKEIENTTDNDSRVLY